MLSNHPNCLGGNGPSASSDLLGDVDGPASATDNAVARFDGTTGKLIQNSAVTIDDTGNITAPDLILGTSGPSAKSSIAARAARQGLVFDGTGVATVTLPVIGTADFAVGAWVKPVAGSTSVIFWGGNNSLGLAVRATTITIDQPGIGTPLSVAYTASGRWIFVVATRSGTTATIYVDGVAIGSGAVSTNFSAATSQLALSTFPIVIAQPVYLNRALSAAEVVSLYEAGVPAGADYNTASNTNLATTTVVASGGTLSGESATGFTMTSASGVAYVGTRPSFGATTTGLAGVAPIGSRWLVTFTATLTSGAAPSLSILQTNSFASISNTATVTAGSNSVVLTTTANGTWVVCPTFYTTSASTYTISAITVTRLGALLAPDAAQSGGGLTWYDTSGNAANITLPATGVSWNVPTSGYLTSSSSLNLRAGGTNQNITLTPSGTGEVSASSNIVLGVANNKLRSGVSNGYITPEDGTIGCVIYSAGGVDFRRNSGTQAMRLVGSNGNLLLNTTTDSGALLQIGTNTVAQTGGMVFGTDTFLYRDAVGTLALNGIGTNSYFSFLENGTAKAFVGTAGGDLYLATSTAKSVLLRTNSILALTIDSSQNATFAGYISTAAAGRITFTGRARLESPVDGVLSLYNAAASDFSRLQFGGTTSSFPALQRSGVQLKVRLADNSDDAELWGKLVSAGAAVTASASTIAYGGTTATTVGAAGAASPLPALPTGYIIVNVAGTNMKVPYFAN